MIAACLGFLCLNFPCARIFMGDVGSASLGFLFSILMIGMAQSILDFLVMAGFLTPFYFDELFSMWIRLRQKQSLLVPHRKHVYQLMANEFGMEHWKISLSYGLLQAAMGEAVIFLSSFGIMSVLAFYGCTGICFICFANWIHRKAETIS